MLPHPFFSLPFSINDGTGKNNYTGADCLTCNGKGDKDEVIATAETADVYQSDRPVYDQLLQELDSTEIYNDSIIYGYWFKPHEACYFNLFLHIDNTFVFKYYVVPNDSTIVDVVKRGSFVVDGEMIKLTADDGWDEKVFNGIVYRKHNGTNFYLTDDEDGMYLVKGSD